MPILLPKNQRRTRAHLILERLRLSIPDARCELYYLTPFQLLVSVVLSAKNTDKMVNRVMQPLYDAGFGPENVLEWGEAGFLERIRSIGLAPTKAKNVHKLSQIIQDRYPGSVPKTREELEELPGVGRKTANVILGELFNEPTLAVDTHVFRVSKRLGLQDASTPEKAERQLLAIIDPSFLPGAHHYLLLHGRYVCKAISPACATCVLNELCPSAQLPTLKTASGLKKKTGLLRTPKAPQLAKGG